METNPYQPPVLASSVDTPQAASEDIDRFPLGLVVLAVLAALHVMVAGVLTLGGLAMGSLPVAIGGLTTVGFQIAIFVGILLRQEWARVLMIWLGYVAVVTYAVQIAAAPLLIVPLVGFEVLTLCFAHSRRVRETTRKKSLAKTYIYRETAPTAKEELE